MLFNSYIFLLLFLPAVILGCISPLLKSHPERRAGWLVLCSLIFYAWWEPCYLLFLFSSLFTNYFIVKKIQSTDTHLKTSYWLLIGITFNLCTLFYFKYVNFFLEILTYFQIVNSSAPQWALPLAISFVTFQQIAFLIDTYRKPQQECPFLYYLLFITFFPQLIAGPIVYFSKIIPQYSKKICLLVTPHSLTIGLAIFCFGLFKKVIIADSFAPYSQALFMGAAQHNITLSFIEAWGGALCYTFQLYFDFSGYSDMAIGLGRIFNVKLPINFNSPYKAKSIIEFWHRWHITLSDFLKNYLYISLGGNRKGILRKHFNLLVTMMLGGLWHGAGLNFIIWGAIHGSGLILNHLWRSSHLYVTAKWTSSYIYQYLCMAFTFVFVVYAWVFFRATDIQSAMKIVHAMSDINGLIIPEHYLSFINSLGMTTHFLNGRIGDIPLFQGTKELLMIGSGLCLAWFLPNTQQIFSRKSFSTTLTLLHWSPTIWWSSLLAMMTVLVLLNLNKMSTFLYYQF